MSLIVGGICMLVFYLVAIMHTGNTHKVDLAVGSAMVLMGFIMHYIHLTMKSRIVSLQHNQRFDSVSSAVNQQLRQEAVHGMHMLKDGGQFAASAASQGAQSAASAIAPHAHAATQYFGSALAGGAHSAAQYASDGASHVMSSVGDAAHRFGTTLSNALHHHGSGSAVHQS
jgi:hypothetical protein